MKKKCVKLEVCGLELMNESQNGVHWRSLCRIYKGFMTNGEYIVGNFSIVFVGIREYKVDNGLLLWMYDIWFTEWQNKNNEILRSKQ